MFSIFFNMKVFCVFSLESPHRGDSNEYTQYTIFNIKRKIDLNYLKSAAMGAISLESQSEPEDQKSVIFLHSVISLNQLLQKSENTANIFLT